MLKTVRDLGPALFRRSVAILGANRSSGSSTDFVAWGRGYSAAKQRCLSQSLANAELMQRFAAFQRLPDRFGVGIDERCVEYPWLVSRLSREPETMLDAGSALNHAFLLDLPQLSTKKLHILTLAPERNCFFQRGIGYLYEDLRRLPLRSELYDCVACISTLEHVGCDNTAYTGGAEHGAEQDPDAFVDAVKELSRVLRPGGSFFLTVPFGKYEHHGSFQQFDAAKLDCAVSAFGPSRSTASSFYRYSADGWNTATAADCADCHYVAWVAKLGGGGPRPNPLPVEPDRAAAARAVACLHIVKS